MEAGTIWLVLASALVLFMGPGLAFFYGGLVRAKSVVSMMMLTFGAMGLVFVLWVIYGYNMTAVGDGDWISGWLGNPFADLFLDDMAADNPAGFASVAFGSTFAVITTALISGAIADRARFFPWLLFAGLWATLVYFPSQGWVWGLDAGGELSGWIGKLSIGDAAAIDWAGGTVVHISAGAAALALALVLGKRPGFSPELHKPHNVPLVLIGVGILWFGWFGFNAGAATEDGTFALIVINTIVCPAAAALAWLVTEHLRSGKATSIGAGSGIVAGLVAITPACANLTPLWSIVLGLVAGAVCALAVGLKFRLGFDDSLDVVGIHLVAGLIGCLYLGFFATDTGLLVGGDLDQLVAQVIPVAVVMAWSFLVALVVGLAISKTVGFRLGKDEEEAGIDSVLHGEDGYSLV